MSLLHVGNHCLERGALRRDNMLQPERAQSRIGGFESASQYLALYEPQGTRGQRLQPKPQSLTQRVADNERGTSSNVVAYVERSEERAG